MIHYFAEFPKTLLNFAESWAAGLRPQVRAWSYGRIPLFDVRQKGVCIFSDLERLPFWKRAMGRQLARRRMRMPDAPLILNDPNRYAGRYQLLRLLHERGVNAFQVSRITDFDRLKFPVFLRSEVDHRGSLTGLLHSPADIRRALSGLSLVNALRKRWLILEEFLDCSDGEGMFRKYSAMNISGTLVPRHILFSRNWETKHADWVSDETVAEEEEFLEAFPHREQVAEVFRLAGVGYGRIDYGIKDGRIQVWEINTNPTIVPAPQGIHPKRMPGQTRSARQIADTLLSLASSG